VGDVAPREPGLVHTIDFAGIRSHKLGQRHSFEELVCQLARRERVAPGTAFRRVDGAGGDGGVEAYWLLPDGAEAGFQAKYFLRTGDIDWEQLDKSVVQAVASHPHLERFVVALPCVLTDRSGAKGKGKRGWEHWKDRVAQWTAHVASVGHRAVRFECWSASEILDRLAQPDAAGLRMYWFEAVTFSPTWFASHVESAIRYLDERFHPEDHVEVAIEASLAAVARSDSYVSNLVASVSKLAASKLHVSERPIIEECMPMIEGVSVALASWSLFADADYSIENDIPYDHMIASLRQLEIAVDRVISWCRSKIDVSDAGDDRAISRIRREASEIGELLDSTTATLRSARSQSENDRAAIVLGHAGSGKSHAFGKFAQVAIAEGRPILFFLGQQFSNRDPWVQIAEILGLEGENADTILSALDSHAQACRRRAVILIDGINEGVGSVYWRDRVGEFVGRIRRYRHISCIVSCRSEYAQYAITESLRTSLRIFEAVGFQSPEEQQAAARVYMDRRHIARPSVPWLSPEFSNPLFLRATCTALQKEGRHEFPRGLRGTKAVLAYYLNAIGRHLGAGRDGSNDLLPGTLASVREVATRMAVDREDYVPRQVADRLIADAFKPFQPPAGQSWLDVLLRNGLFRADPLPLAGDDDPLIIPVEVVRFSFQRFQDFLMADGLLQGVSNARDAFASDGSLSFVIGNDHPNWRWTGLFDALATIIPERDGVELVDVLPGGPDTWWSWHTRSAFEESVRWRSVGAFSDRTLQLLNALGSIGGHPIDLLLDVAVVADHPWNAQLIHKNLLKRSMPDRDRFWTTSINGSDDGVGAPIERLIDWAFRGQSPSTERKNQLLAAITLCWLLTSTNRRLRDRATKALTSLVLARADLYPELVDAFATVDDPYVHERLVSSAFGACCLDPSVSRLIPYAVSTYQQYFASGQAPTDLLLRDYARGIVERCLSIASLPPGIDLALVRPPYRSPRPRLTVSEEQLNKIAERAGGRQIVHSATSMGDFARYEIESRTRDFMCVPLSKLPLLGKVQLKRKFEREVISHNASRRSAFELFESASNPYSSGLYTVAFDLRKPRPPSAAKLRKWTENLDRAVAAVASLLTTDEQQRFKREVVDKLAEKQGRSKDAKFVPASLQRWVAARAYRIGWTAKRFEHEERGYGDYGSGRARVERIGKKYQWIALSELLCRLADNYWLKEFYGELPKTYENPLDIGYFRDVDPTILTDLPRTQTAAAAGDNTWVGNPWIAAPSALEDRVADWPLLEDPGAVFDQMIVRRSPSGSEYLVLYEHQSSTDEYPGERLLHGLRLQEFRFVYGVQVKASQLESLLTRLRAHRSLDTTTWQPPEYTDAGYFGEAPWRDTWPASRWRTDTWGLPAEVELAFPVSFYQWESHLDASLPEGASYAVPSVWVANELSLSLATGRRDTWELPDGRSAMVSFVSEDRGRTVLLKRDAAEQLNDGGQYAFLWLLIAERSAWPGGNNDLARWRRSEGICWLEGGEFKKETWYRDEGHGSADSSAGK
jgi:hypothetical protein